jgi:hypothetical protein
MHTPKIFFVLGQNHDQSSKGNDQNSNTPTIIFATSSNGIVSCLSSNILAWSSFHYSLVCNTWHRLLPATQPYHSLPRRRSSNLQHPTLLLSKSVPPRPMKMTQTNVPQDPAVLITIQSFMKLWVQLPVWFSDKWH